jgi:hypothetical protein
VEDRMLGLGDGLVVGGEIFNVEEGNVSDLFV